jgi:hypothetical protein
MLTVRLSKAEWAKAWRAMIEVAPVRLIRDDPVYEVLPAHLEALTARGFTYEVVQRIARHLSDCQRPINRPSVRAGNRRRTYRSSSHPAFENDRAP